jgi:septum formation protein
MDTPLILASSSPRRRELLGALGVKFEIVTADVVELDALTAPQLSPAELAVANADLKARKVAMLHPGRWILGADTVVALDERVFGKPDSLAQARLFLAALSGCTHEVITGCVLLDPRGASDRFHEFSTVRFHDLTDDTITHYLAAVHVLDKAGGYALQEGSGVVAEVRGSRDNVIGLPTERLADLLRRRGLL